MSTVPASSGAILVGTMLTFFAGSMVFVFQAPPVWWALPGVLALVVISLATVRIRRYRRMREQLQGSHR